jgi:hypothetical protein
MTIITAILTATIATATSVRNYIARYHWCPGDFWRPEWGLNFDWNTCHDDHHRDGDGDNHDHDFWG